MHSLVELNTQHAEQGVDKTMDGLHGFPNHAAVTAQRAQAESAQESGGASLESLARRGHRNHRQE